MRLLFATACFMNTLMTPEENSMFERKNKEYFEGEVMPLLAQETADSDQIL